MKYVENDINKYQAKIIISKSCEIGKNSIINTMIMNFVKEYYGCIIQCSYSLDCYLYHKFNIKGISLMINKREYLYDVTLDILSIDAQNYINKFILLVDIISKKIDNDDPWEKTFITYYLLYNTLFEYAYDVGQKKYDINLPESSIDDIVIWFYDNFGEDLDLEPMFMVFLMSSNKYKSFSFVNFHHVLKLKLEELSNVIRKKDYEKSFENVLLYGKTHSIIHQNDFLSIDSTDSMSGIEFEKFIFDIFVRIGYTCQFTKTTGDQGIDIIAKKNDSSIGIQAKCYSSTVGNKAVQEAVAGKNFYNVDKVMVVTNNYFTSSAIELAQVNDVTLWNRDDIEKRLKLIKELSIL